MVEPVKTLIHPGTGETFKLGRLKPKAKGPMLSLENYLLRKFPAAPSSIDYSARPMSCLNDVYGNDIAGCCVVSAGFHVKSVLFANSNKPIDFATPDVLNLYKFLSGWDGVEDSISDTGLDEVSFLNFWTTTGLGPDQSTHKITSALRVDPTDQGEIKAAIWLFQNVYLAASLCDEWVTPMPSKSGFVWDVAGPPNPENGHAFMSMAYRPKDYTADGILIDTWGMLGLLTWAAIAKYCAVYTVLADDIIDVATQVSSGGVNWTQLLSDMQSMGAGT
jgi:hypothetical protein